MYTKSKWIRGRSGLFILSSFSYPSSDYKLYNGCDTAIGLELAEAFLANVDRKGKTSDSFHVLEVATLPK